MREIRAWFLEPPVIIRATDNPAAEIVRKLRQDFFLNHPIGAFTDLADGTWSLFLGRALLAVLAEAPHLPIRERPTIPNDDPRLLAALAIDPGTRWRQPGGAVLGLAEAAVEVLRANFEGLQSASRRFLVLHEYEGLVGGESSAHALLARRAAVGSDIDALRAFLGGRGELLAEPLIGPGTALAGRA